MKKFGLFTVFPIFLSSVVCAPALAQEEQGMEAGEAEIATDNNLIDFRIETIDPDLDFQLDFEESEGLGANSNLSIVPVPVLNPTLKAGGGVAALYTFGSGARRSTLFAGGGATGNGSWLAAAGGNLYLGHDKFKIKGGGGYGSLKLKYYGIGPGSVFADNPVDFGGEGWLVLLNPEFEIFDDFYIGVLGRYLDAKITTEIPIEVIPDISVPFEVITAGPTVEFISTDYPNWPTSGAHVQAQWLYNKETKKIFNLGFDTEFMTFDMSGSTFFGFSDDLVLGINGRVAGSDNDAPFFLKPSVSLRGYAAGELRDNYIAEAQAELRWMFARKFGVVAFAGVSASSEDFVSYGKATAAYGVGVRYRYSEIDRSNIGFDFAKAGGNFAVYFALGEAF